MSNGYENAPQTLMLAVFCAACSRPLCDSESVTAGMGPDCREKYGIFTGMSEDQREAANKLILKAAVAQKGEDALNAAVELQKMGLTKLSTRIIKRCAKIWLAEDGADRLAVHVPYNDLAVAEMKNIKGRQYRKEGKEHINSFPKDPITKAALLSVLAKYFDGWLACGPKGAFIIKPLAVK